MSAVRVVSIERVSLPEPDVIELVAVAPCTAAAIAMADRETVRFVREASDAPMAVVVADARYCVTIAPPEKNLRARVAIAIVAVEALADFEPEFVSSDFDAVLPVAIGNGNADAALSRALRDVVAFATSPKVTIPVQEANRFFVGAGRLRSGSGEAPSIASAVRAAVRDAGGVLGGRLLVNLEVGKPDWVAELRHVTAALREITADELWFSASQSHDDLRRATLLLAAPRRARGDA